MINIRWAKFERKSIVTFISGELPSAARARVGMDCTISIKTSSAKMAADLNFAVCVSFREDKPKTKQLRFLL